MQENIIIQLNGAPFECAGGINYLTLIALLELEPKSLAIERNLAILPRSEWESCGVENGDKVEIVQFVGGGI